MAKYAAKKKMGNWYVELQDYLRPFRRYPVLSPAEFLRLYAALLTTTGRRWMDAHRRLLYGNVRLVVPIARRYLGRGLSIADLMQEGLLGVECALAQYDEKMGNLFSTYAVWWIGARIRRAIVNLNERDFCRLPVHVHDRMRLVRFAISDFQHEGKAWPTIDDVVRRLHASKSKTAQEMSRALVAELMVAVTRKPFSLDALAWEKLDGKKPNADTIPDPGFSVEKNVDSRRMGERLRRLLTRTLSSTEAHILRHRFGIGDAPELTLQEIGETFGVSRERIRQIEKKAIRKLRTRLGVKEAEQLKEFIQSF